MRLLTTLCTGCLFFLFLNGCSMAPEYQRPPLPVADSFQVQEDLLGKPAEGMQHGKKVSELGWRNVFIDPCLRQLITAALQNNRDLRETILNVAAFEAQYRIRRAAQLPTISGDGFARKQSGLSGDSHFTSETYSLAVGTTAYELDLYGRIRNLKDQALEQYLARQETRKSATIGLVANVAVSYLTWLTDRELLLISEDTRKIEEESYSLIQQRAQAGISSDLDLAQARTSLEAVKANLALYRRQVAQDLHLLTLLTGISLPESLLRQAGSLDDQTPLAVIPSTLSSTILLERPDIMAAEHELKGANANIGAARAAFFPTVSLTANAGVISSDLADLFDGGSGSWLFSPAINLPIFTAGRLSADLDVAKVNRDIFIARYENAIQTAFREVSDALVANTTYQDQLLAQKANLTANEEYYTLARDRYQQGVDSFLILLDAQRSLYSSRQNYLVLRFAQLANQVNLYKVLGGGWKEQAEGS